MNNILRISLNLDKIPASAIKHGEKGRYLDLVTIPDTINGQDLFGNDGIVAISLSKARRDAGESGAIVGKFQIK